MMLNASAVKATDLSSSRPSLELTILIPTYQCAPYLPAAVESALHSPAVSILIADDGSGLEAPRVAQVYEKDYPDRVRVLCSRRRRGVARNINDAVRHVRTPFFAKLDGDDVLIPGHLEAAFGVISQRPDVAIVAGHEVRMASGEMLKFESDSCPRFEADPQPRILSGPEAYEFILRWSPNPCSSGAIYRTEAFREIGGFDPAIRWGEDWEIWLRFAQRWSVAYCHAPSAMYRIHERSSTARQQRQFALCFGYDAVYRRGAELCKSPQVTPLLRESFLRVACLYAKAASRHSLRLRADAFVCAYYALRALLAAAAPDRVKAAARPTRRRRTQSRGRRSSALLVAAAAILLCIVLLYRDADLSRPERPKPKSPGVASRAVQEQKPDAGLVKVGIR